MRTDAEVQQALDNVERDLAAIDRIACPSERAAAYAQQPNREGERTAFKWVLEGKQPVFQWVDSTHVQAFQHYLAHYHDDQEEALQETSNDHYERWLDTAEPGDQYTVSENDHSLDPYEPEFEVVHVDESEFGHHYQLTFPNMGAAMAFGRGWGKVLTALIAREEQPSV